MRRLVATALAAICLGAIAPAVAPAAVPGIPEPGHGWLACGEMEPATYEIRAKNAACSTARKVVRKAFRKMSDSLDFSGTRAKGFQCVKRISLYDGSVYGCRRGEKLVRFYVGG